MPTRFTWQGTTQQPQQVAGPASWAKSAGCSLLVNGAFLGYDASDGSNRARTFVNGTVNRAVTAAGIGECATDNGGSGQANAYTKAGNAFGSGDFTTVVIADGNAFGTAIRQYGAGGFTGVAFQQNSEGITESGRVNLFILHAGVQRNDASVIGGLRTGVAAYVWRKRGTTISCWINGRSQTVTNSGSWTSTGQTTASDTVAWSGDVTSSSLSLVDPMVLGGVFLSALPDSLCAELSTFSGAWSAYQPRRIFVPVAAAGGGDAAASGDLAAVALSAADASATGGAAAAGNAGAVALAPASGAATGAAAASATLAAVALSAHDGAAVGAAAASAAPAAISLLAADGLATGAAVASGSAATIALSAATGSAVGGAGGDAFAVGALAGVPLSAAEGSATGGAAAAASPAPVALSATDGAATGGAAAAASLAPIALSAVAGSATGAAAAAGALAPVALSPTEGGATGGAGGDASAFGAFMALVLGPVDGSAAGGAVAAGAVPAVALSAASGSASAGVPPTTGRPASDTSNTGWTASTGSDLYAMLDEVTPSAADYIVAASTGAVCELALNATGYPGSASQILRFRASSSTGNSVIVRLKNTGGATVRSATQLLTASDTEYAITLTAGEIAAITSGALSVQLESA